MGQWKSGSHLDFTLFLTIDRNGRVAAADVVGGGALGECAQGLAKNWTFPKPTYELDELEVTIRAEEPS